MRCKWPGSIFEECDRDSCWWVCLLLICLPFTAAGQITSGVNTVTYTCTGATGPFAFTFPAFDASGFAVVETVTSTNIQTTLASSAYTSTPVNLSYMNGGSVTLNTACPSGDTLTIQRETEQTQLNVFTQNMPALYPTFQSSLDKLTMEVQDLKTGNLNDWSNAGAYLNYVPVCKQLDSLGNCTSWMPGEQSSSTAGNPAGPSFAVNFANNGVTAFQADPNILVNPNTHTITSPNIFSTSNPVISADAKCSSGDGYGGTDYLYCMQQACNAVPNGSQATIELSNGPHTGYSQFACAKSVTIKGNGAIIELEPKGSGPGVFTTTASAPFISLAGCTLTPGSVLVTGCSNTGSLQIYDRVGGAGVPVGAYVNCLGVWSAGTCTPTAGEFSLSLPAQLYVTGALTSGQTAMTGLGILTDVTNGMALGSYTGIPPSTTISGLHYGGSSPYDVQSLTLSNAATQTVPLATVPIASTWTATLTSTPTPPIPAIQMSWSANCMTGPEGPCTEAGIQDLTVIDPSVRSLSNAAGIQITGYDHFKYSQVQVLDLDGFGTEFGGPLTASMAANGPGKGTVRETDLYQAIDYYDGDWATGQAGVEAMTGYPNCYPAANCSTVVDEINEFRGYGVHFAANFGANFVVGSYNPAVFGTDNGPRHITMVGQFESLQESGSSGSVPNLYAPPAADNIIIQSSYSSVNFIGSEINDAGWGHFLINSRYDGGTSFTGGTRVISQLDPIVYTVSSAGGTTTVQFVSQSGGLTSFDQSGQWNGGFGILIDNGSCAAPGCNVYFSPSGAVTNGGQTLNLAAPLYGTTTDATATLTVGQPAFYGNFANSAFPANFVSAQLYDPDDTTYRGYGGSVSAVADHLWAGVYPSFNNFGQEIENLQTPYTGNTGKSIVAPNLATNDTVGFYSCLDKAANISGDCAGWQYRNLTGAQSGSNRIEGVIGGNTWITYTNGGNLNFLPSDVGNLQIGGTTWLTAGRGGNFSSLIVNSGTAVTSQSSANSQMVTCPSGGSGTEVCDASGAWIANGSGGGTTTNPLTMNNSGSGAASGATFNGSAAETISYNTIGAAPAIPNQFDESSNFTAACNASYNVTASVTATLPSTCAVGGIVAFQVKSNFTLTVSAGSIPYTGPASVAGPASFSAIYDGTNLNAAWGNATTLAGLSPADSTAAAVTTGPASGTTANDLVTMNGTNGRVKDSGVLITAIPNANISGLGTLATIATGTLTNGDFCTYSSTGPTIACNASSSTSISFPQTVSGTTTSGGIPYFSNTTTLSSSGLLAANDIVVGGGAGTAPSTDADASLSSGALTLGASGTAGTTILYPAGGNVTTTLGSAATSSNTVDFFSAAPTNLHMPYCAVSSTTCTLTDTGYAYNAIPYADLSITAANIGTLFNIAQYAEIYSNGTTAAPLGLAAPTTNADWFTGYHITGSAASAPANEELVASTTNADGLTVTPTYNATGPTQRFEITGSYSGSLASGTGLTSSQVTTALGYTPANCTPGTSGSDCLQLSSGLVPTGNLPGYVADTTVTIGSSVAFAANTCSSATGVSGTASTVSMSGLATTMTATFTPNSDVHSVTGWSPGSGGQLYFTAWPSASGTLSYYVCNGTASSITTSASTTWNVSAK